MKIKLSIWVFVFGFIVDFIGVWMKITHQAFGDLVLAFASVLKIIGLLLLTTFLLGHPQVKEFLNYDKFKDSFK